MTLHLEPFALSAWVDLINDTNALMTDRQRGIWRPKLVHEVAVTQRGCLDFDEKLTLLWLWHWNIINDLLVIRLDIFVSFIQS